MLFCAHLQTHMLSILSCLIVVLPVCRSSVNLYKFVLFVSMVLSASCSKTHFFSVYIYFFFEGGGGYSLLSMEALPVNHRAGKGRMHMQPLGFVCCEEFWHIEAIFYFILFLPPSTYYFCNLLLILPPCYSWISEQWKCMLWKWCVWCCVLLGGTIWYMPALSCGVFCYMWKHSEYLYTRWFTTFSLFSKSTIF